MSCVSMMSFTPKGSPFSGPGDPRPARSRERASASARSGSRKANARTTESRAPMRSRQARVSASAVRRPAAIAASASIASNSFGACAIGNPPRCNGSKRNGVPCDWAYPVLPIAAKLRRGQCGDGNTGGVPDHGSQSTWHQGSDGGGRAGDHPGRSMDRARTNGAAPRAAGGSQDPGHRSDDEQHHQQSRLHDLRRAVRAGQQAHAEAADGGDLHEERGRPQLDVQAAARDSSSTMASR